MCWFKTLKRDKSKVSLVLYYLIKRQSHSSLNTRNIYIILTQLSHTSVPPPGISNTDTGSSFRWWRRVCRSSACYPEFSGSCGGADAPVSLSLLHEQKPLSINFLVNRSTLAPPSNLQPVGERNQLSLSEYLWMVTIDTVSFICFLIQSSTGAAWKIWCRMYPENKWDCSGCRLGYGGGDIYWPVVAQTLWLLLHHIASPCHSHHLAGGEGGEGQGEGGVIVVVLLPIRKQPGANRWNGAVLPVPQPTT